MIKAVLFDVFGTLVEIKDRRRPYAHLLRLAEHAGRVPRPDDAAQIMSMNGDIWSIASWLGLSLTPTEQDEIASSLQRELASVMLFLDVIPVLCDLRERGVQLGVCSNLAKPYAAPVLSFLPFELDAYVWSFEVGAIKPDHRIYESACHSLRLRPEEVLMVGDTYEADYLGPKRFGMHALHLTRDCENLDTWALRSLDDLASRAPTLPGHK